MSRGFQRRHLAALLFGLLPAGAAFGQPLDAGGAFTRGRSLRRLALVFGAQTYPEPIPALSNAWNDAAAIARSLEDSGFTVVRSVPDPTAQDILTYTQEVAQLAGETSLPAVLVVFFAGHGFEAEGEEYLVPVDAVAGELGETSVPVRQVLAPLGERPGLTVAFIDACRSLPPDATPQARAPIQGNFPNLVLSMATQSTARALSAAHIDDAQSPYSTALTRALSTRARSLSSLLQDVKTSVEMLTRHNQSPQSPDDLGGASLGAHFYFRPDDANLRQARDKWLAALATGRRTCVERYVRTYRASDYVTAALAWIAASPDSEDPTLDPGGFTCAID